MSAFKRLAKRAFRLAGLTVARANVGDGSRGTVGTNPLEDMRLFLEDRRCPIVIDVGANEGQSVERFLRHFPDAQVHSFEPGPAAYQKLARVAAQHPNVTAHNLGVAAASGQLEFLENNESDMSSFLAPGNDSWGKVVSKRMVDTVSVDDYCRTHHIERVDILKIDTQGFDLEVLRGSAGMLSSRRIRLVYLEVIFSELYENAAQFDELWRMLVSCGLKLVSIYDIHHRNNLAGWADALFVNPGATG